MSEPVTRVLQLPVPGQVDVTVKIDSPAEIQPLTPVLILAHGSTNNLEFPLLAYLAKRLSEKRLASVVRFNFPFAQRGASSPDPRAVLEDTMSTVHKHIEIELAGPGRPIFLGGKSLGARTAAELVSRGLDEGGLPAAGLILLVYPLHSPGRKEQLHLEPLRRIAIPSLFFSGTRDPLCDPQLLRPVLAGLDHPGELYVVEGGDHSLHLPRSLRKSPDDSYPTIADQVERFIDRVAKAS